MPQTYVGFKLNCKSLFIKIGSCRKDLFMNDLNEVNAILKRIINGVAIAVKKLTAIEQRMLNTTIDKEFAELNTTSTFVKAKANAFEIEKTLLSFVSFDNNTKKLKDNIDIFMSFGDSLALANDILSGKICKLAQKSRKDAAEKNLKYPADIYKSRLGGVAEEKAKERKLRTDGKAISRYFSIAPGSKFDFVFTAYQQVGKSADNGLIVPEGNPEIIIRVGCNAPDIKNFALLLQSHINGYISAQYATHAYCKKDAK